MISNSICSSLVYFFIICMCIYRIVNIIAKFFWNLSFMYVTAYHSTFSNFNLFIIWVSVQFSHSVVSDFLRPCGLKHARPPCPSPTPGVYSNSCPLPMLPSNHLILCRPLLLLRLVFPTSRSFQMSQLFASGGQSIGVSASTSVLPMNTRDWSPLGWTGCISLKFKGLSRVFLQHHSSKASVLWHSAFFIVQFPRPYMTSGKTIALTRQNFVGKVMSPYQNNIQI